MCERFSARAREVLELGLAEARRRHHEYFGTEHILLGLLLEKKGIAAVALL